MRRLIHCVLAALTLTAYYSVVTLTACSPEPPLHLYNAQEADLYLPVIDLNLEVYWDYEIAPYESYDWRDEWYYGWDDEDRRIFGELGYTEPKVYNLRRYYTAQEPYAPHTGVIANTFEGTSFRARYDWGFWDLLCWNQVETIDGVQSLIFDEQTTLDSVVAYTNPSMYTSRYQAPRYTNAFYAPEPLFSAYEQAVEVNRNLDGFTYDPEQNIYYRRLNMQLMPITYIYLTQVIIHHNNGRIAAVDGQSNLSGMARTTTLNTGTAGEDAITVYYNSRLKRNMPMVPYSGKLANGTGADEPQAEYVDIIGGRLMTFGMCRQTANTIRSRSEVTDSKRHYMDVTMQFHNGLDSTFVFDVTDQVRRRYKGGVITVEIDMDTIPIPTRSGGSGFDAVVEDYKDGGTHEFDI